MLIKNKNSEILFGVFYEVLFNKYIYTMILRRVLKINQMPWILTPGL